MYIQNNSYGYSEDYSENSWSKDFIRQDKFLIDFNNILLKNKNENQNFDNLSLKNSESSQSNISFKIIEFTGRKRIRSKIKRRRREYHDNIRKKIKRNFFNKILVKKMNKELKKGGSRKYFALFPQEIVADVTRKRNKKLLNMTLRQVITNSELYKSKSYNNFIHNINVLESLNDSKNNILENLLNSKYSELFDQYLKSDSFENDVNKLKQKEEKEIYIERYEYLSKTWLEFFSN
jgi:hypothetical protein